MVTSSPMLAHLSDAERRTGILARGVRPAGTQTSSRSAPAFAWPRAPALVGPGRDGEDRPRTAVATRQSGRIEHYLRAFPNPRTDSPRSDLIETEVAQAQFGDSARRRGNLCDDGSCVCSELIRQRSGVDHTAPQGQIPTPMAT